MPLNDPPDGNDTNNPRATAREASAASTADERPTRKNYYLYQSKIDMAREILAAKSETEAIDTALDLLIYGEALARGTEAMGGEIYNDVFGIEDEIPSEGAES